MVDVEQAGPQLRTIDALKRMYEDAAHAQQDARQLSFRDRNWYDNADEWHWTEEEKQELKDRGQPPVAANDIKRNVNFLLGFEQRSRTDPRAFPRKPGDEQSADVVTDVLDYIEQRTRFDKSASEAFKDYVIEGIEAAEVIYEDDEVTINRISFDKFFYDPRSRERDFCDARWVGYVDWFDLEEAQALFPNRADELEEACSGNEYDEGFDDKPNDWADRNRQRVRIAVAYYKLPTGEYAYAYYTAGVILREGVSDYVDESGKPCCPIIAQSCYVTRENHRYGVVRDMISPQREKNWRRSLALYLLKSRRMWSQEGVFKDAAKAKKEAARADGLLQVNGEFGRDWGFIDNMAEASGMLQLSQQSEADLDRLGPNRSAGQAGQASSGRDRALLQNAAVTEENTLFDGHTDWKLRIYRAMWERAKQFWTEQKYIRVTENEDAYRFVAVNEMTVVEDPNTGQLVPMVNNLLAQMDVDITIEAMRDALTLQHEQFEVFLNVLPTLVQAPPQYTEMVLDMAPNLRDKSKLKEKMQEMAAQAQQAAAQQQQIAQMQIQLQMQKLQGEIINKQADAEKTRAETLKTGAEAEGEALENVFRAKASMQPVTTVDANVNI